MLAKIITAAFIVALVILVLLYQAVKQLLRDAKANKIGKEGEALVEKVIKQSKIPGRLYKNIYILFPDGNSTEIDLVFLTNRGIYVIESKNYSGIVYGSEGEHDWVVKYKNGKSFKFYSPILQNQGHINALAYSLRINKSCIQSIVVFGSKTELNISNIKTPVLKPDKLGEYLKFTYNNSPINIDNMTVESLSQQLSRLVGVNPVTKAKHKYKVKTKYYK